MSRSAQAIYLTAILASLGVTPPVSAVDVRVMITNLSPAGGNALSPFTVAAHDGTFDAFNAGSTATTLIENVAELGDGTQLIAAVMAAQPSAVTGTVAATTGGFGPGIFLPGGSGSLVLSLDPVNNRYLTYGSMVVPSNDAFLGNDSPTSVELFDAAGNFVATEVTLNGASIWDAGTEVNQPLGAAYLVGQDAMLGTIEAGGVVHAANPANQFAPYLNGEVPSGGMFTVAPAAASPVASISLQVVPEPSAFLLLSAGLLAFGVGRRGRRAGR
jgi:hypothetical protein